MQRVSGQAMQRRYLPCVCRRERQVYACPQGILPPRPPHLLHTPPHLQVLLHKKAEFGLGLLIGKTTRLQE